jgi:hypothetical protein
MNISDGIFTKYHEEKQIAGEGGKPIATFLRALVCSGFELRSVRDQIKE